LPLSAKPTVSTSQRNCENIELAKKAANNDAQARKQVNNLLAPIIQYQTNRFCKRFCKENSAHYKCTLKPPLGSPPADASLCEWGNGCYTWMLDDLSSSKRLLKFQAKNNATLFDYCYVIANSLPFYERWKDWRFGRKNYVPSYIQSLGKAAVSVFYGLQSQQSIEQISQVSAQTVLEATELSRNIIRLLSSRNKLHLLNRPHSVSFTQDNDVAEDVWQGPSNIESETASHDEAIELREDKQKLKKAWHELSAVEQFVIEALVIEEQEAQIVLDALKTLNLSIKQGVPAGETDRQQLYYFRRKTLAKLNALMKK
jgi:hypothetical protein